MKRLAQILFLLGVAFYFTAFFMLWQRYSPKRLSFNNYSPQIIRGSESSLQPIGLEIDSLKISLPVYYSNVNNGNWESTTKGVSFLITSALPGEQGNSVFYGHNWPNLLGRLPEVKEGDDIKVIYSDGSINKFKVFSTLTVSPQDVYVLNNSDDKMLTLYTCTGLLDSKRFVAQAKLEI